MRATAGAWADSGPAPCADSEAAWKLLFLASKYTIASGNHGIISKFETNHLAIQITKGLFTLQ